MKNKAKSQALKEAMDFASKLMADRIKGGRGKKKPVAMSVSIETAEPRDKEDDDLKVVDPVPMAGKDDRKSKLRKAVGLA